MSHSRVQQNDFILTLSDHEDDDGEESPALPSPDPEAHHQDDGSRKDTQSRKRKKELKSNGKDASNSKRVKLDEVSLNKPRSNPEGHQREGRQADPKDATVEVEDDDAVDSEFEFAHDGLDTGVLEDFDGWEREGGRENVAGTVARKGLNLEEIIARRRDRKRLEAEPDGTDSEEAGTAAEATDEHVEEEQFEGFDAEEDELLADDAFGMGAPSDGEDENEEPETDGTDHHDGEDTSDKSSVASLVPHPDDEASLDGSDDGEDRIDPKEEARRRAFFASEDDVLNKARPAKGQAPGSFQSMALSRPVLKGLAGVGFNEPTPIQAKAIPVALLGQDVVGGAVTGSGKTAAFLVPILERLLYRPRRIPTSRVAILMPTRELAVQCYNVAKRLAAFTDITFCRLVGGFSLREQENELKKRPDVIVATPGRFIDHMRNSVSFTVETLEILVLDEADRMLQEGFADELNEILSTIPKSRQTMLFSATMTDSVDKLIHVGMTRPVRLMLAARSQTVGTLIQEFIRLRPGRESKRMGYLIFLCHEVYTERAIVFFRQRKEAHRARIIFGLLGLKASELHGSMGQEQRIQNVEAFRDGKVSFLLATDLASRGLDIKGVQTVINYEAPQSHEIYLHRVGRTARAGRAGRACTLAAENDRKVVKSIVKVGRSQGAKIVSRLVEASRADEWAGKVEALEEEIEAILREEKEEKELAQVEMQVTRGDNIIKHEGEIMSRPKRTWFESERDKKAAQKLGSIELNGVRAAKPKEKGKPSAKQMKRAEARDQFKEGKLWKKGKKDTSVGSAGPSGKSKTKKKPAGKPRLRGKGRS